ncbi:hypothetical protein M087_3484 [Bacteroides fragilis str. S23 R14]|uniref:Uncharacterized protein n=1 Tax=Bacteroides fragilis TaxID=817 RepID=A0A853PRY0_BACFG|nr:hypothetical protein M077_3953 [Bacteroides fragilis str. 2-F-2 \
MNWKSKLPINKTIDLTDRYIIEKSDTSDSTALFYYIPVLLGSYSLA